jgi:hypothetical protein
MHRFSAYLLIILIISTSCKKIRDDLLPEGITRMYCQSILTPGSAISVCVGRTTGITINAPHYIDDATVLLYINGNLADSLTNDSNGTYKSDEFPVVGNLYTIEVIKEDTITGSSTVPDSTKIIEPKIEFPTGYDAVNEQYYGQLSFEIRDNPNVENFYEVLIFTRTQNDLTNTFYYQYYNDPNYIILPDKVVQNEGDWDYSPTTLFFSDQLFNGKKQQISFSIASGYGIINDVWTSNLEENGYVLLRSISKEYYLYRKFYTRHSFNSQIHSDGIRNLLFTGEPLDMYTNVEGGLGIVAAFSSTINKIKRK